MSLSLFLWRWQPQASWMQKPRAEGLHRGQLEGVRTGTIAQACSLPSSETPVPPPRLTDGHPEAMVIRSQGQRAGGWWEATSGGHILAWSVKSVNRILLTLFNSVLTQPVYLLQQNPNC